jgi:hypothetical protein
MSVFLVTVNVSKTWLVVAGDVGQATSLVSAKCRELGIEVQKIKVQAYSGLTIEGILQ